MCSQHYRSYTYHGKSRKVEGGRRRKAAAPLNFGTIKMVHIWPVMLAAHGLYTAYVQLYMASMLAMYGHL